MRQIVFAVPYFYDYLISIGVEQGHIITLALDDIENMKYRNPLELGKYLRGLIVDNKMYYVQSALYIGTTEKRLQETNSLNRIDDSFKKIAVVKDKIIPWHDEKGVLYVGIEEFLLDESSMEL